MFFDLPYGRDRKTVRIPDGVQVDYLLPDELPPLPDLKDAFLTACYRPIDSEPLETLARRAGKAVVLISDLTRSGGTKAILSLCLELLRSSGLAAGDIKVLIARGTHRRLTREEKQYFKTKEFAGIAVLEHDCDDSAELSALLLTSRGTPIRVNRAIKTAGLVVLLAPVSFHYFAGFGGGRKLIMPGCADRPSILANHRLSLLDSTPVRLNPLCRSGVLEGNPVHEDMIETLAAVKGVFAINFFGNMNAETVFLNAGAPQLSHRQACDAYRSGRLQAVDDPYGVLVLSPGGFPFDINLLQSHKALRQTCGAVQPEGAVLLLAECSEGVGSSGLEGAFDQPKDLFLKTAYSQYRHNNQTAVSLMDMQEKFKIGVVTALSQELIEKFRFEPCENMELFIAASLERTGASRIGIVPHGNSILIDSSLGGRQ
jgi:nickel-dependent lactate racemase